MSVNVHNVHVYKSLGETTYGLIICMCENIWLLDLLTGHFEWTSTGANHRWIEITITFSSLLVSVQQCVFTRVQMEI